MTMVSGLILGIKIKLPLFYIFQLHISYEMNKQSVERLKCLKITFL